MNKSHKKWEKGETESRRGGPYCIMATALKMMRTMIDSTVPFAIRVLYTLYSYINKLIAQHITLTHQTVNANATCGNFTDTRSRNHRVRKYY
jgi:hypothetical protein